MKKRTILAGLCVAVCAGALAVARFYPSEAAPEPPEVSTRIPVNTAKVQVGDVPIVLTGIGSVQAYNVVDVHTQIPGTIQQIGFVEGQVVHKGSLIAQLDPRPYQAALQQAEANLARDEAQLTNAQVNLNRFTPLLKQGFASAQQVTDQAAQVSQLQASVAADKATIFNAQTQLGYTTITSPIDGVTGIRQRRYRQHRPTNYHHADRDDHADPADFGRLHSAAEGRSRGAGGDGEGHAEDAGIRPGRPYPP